MQRRLLKRMVIAAAALTVAVPTVAACGSGYEAGVINIYPPADGASEIAKVAEKCSADSGGAYRIVSTPLPKSADDQRLQLARRLAGNDHGLDLMGMDVVWTAEFADAGWLQPVPDDLAKTISAQTLSGPLETARWKTPSDTGKRLYAIPTWTNTQFVWYRPDILKQYLHRTTAPTTWDQMLADNKVITDAGGPSYIMVQGKQYEGLMVWFTAVLASAGGAILDPNDPTKVTLADTPEHRAATVKALQILKAVATAPGHDPSLTNSDEGAGRLGMETGKASFEINWPFVFASMRSNAAAGDVPFFTDGGKLIPALAPYASLLTNTDNPPTDAQLVKPNKVIRTKFNWGLYPGVSADQTMRPPLGGINIAVASTSRQPELAFRAAQCLTDAQAQKQYAVSGGTPPTISSIYDEPDFKAAYPMGDDIRTQLEVPGPPVRPESPVYQSISTLVTAKLSPVGQWDPEAMVDPLVEQVRKAIDGKGLVP